MSNLFDFKDQPLTLHRSNVNGYPHRTKENAKADVTLAFAVNFNSAGEKLTKKYVLGQGKIYIPIDLTKDSFDFDELIKILNSYDVKTINIAGNGLYTLKGKYTQTELNYLVRNFLEYLLNHPDFKCKIEQIRSGGQSGADEAGIFAALYLKIPALVYYPKDSLYKDRFGITHSDDNYFRNIYNNYLIGNNRAYLLEQNKINYGLGRISKEEFEKELIRINKNYEE